jgi:CelD/BcsL family acetyltransferase involved in cellulose biosynthesis
VLRFEHFEGSSQSVQHRWHELWAKDPLAGIFHDYKWIETYDRIVRPIRFVIATQDAVPVAGIALCKSPTGGWKCAGGSFSDYRGPILAAVDFRDEFIQGLVASWGSVWLGEHVRERVGEKAVPSSVCLRIRLTDSAENLHGRLGKSLRVDLRNWKSSGSSVEVVSPTENLSAFREMVRLHNARWARRGMPGAFRGASSRFHAAWIERAEGAAKFLVAKNPSGEVIGVLYSLHSKRETAYYQAGIDPVKAGSTSPGSALIWQAILESIQHDDVAFDFLRGDEPYKKRWKPTDTRMLFRTQYTGDHWTAPLQSKLTQFAWALERDAKSWLEGRLGPKNSKSR